MPRNSKTSVASATPVTWEAELCLWEFSAPAAERADRQQLAQTIRALTGSTAEIKHAPVRAGDVRHSRASIDKMRAAGFVPPGNFAEGLQATVDFFKGKPA